MTIAASSAAVNGLWVDVTTAKSTSASIRLSTIGAIDIERNVVNMYHSGGVHGVRFDTEAEAAALYASIKAAIV